MHDRIEALIGTLAESEQVVIKARYGLEDGRPKSLRVISKMLGKSPEQVRRMEQSGFKKLRAAVSKEKRQAISPDTSRHKRSAYPASAIQTSTIKRKPMLLAG
ncbi:MAG: hypothetical protein F6K19_32965 [Cyanothece sp. SIO1E1]|nr:hypothetical protein [Cyanothece sp. SIO1E1]